MSNSVWATFTIISKVPGKNEVSIMNTLEFTFSLTEFSRKNASQKKGEMFNATETAIVHV